MGATIKLSSLTSVDIGMYEQREGHEPTEVPLFAQIYCTTDNKKKILMFSYTWIMM